MNEPDLLYEALENGAEKARAIAKVNLAEGWHICLDLQGAICVVSALKTEPKAKNQAKL